MTREGFFRLEEKYEKPIVEIDVLAAKGVRATVERPSPLENQATATRAVLGAEEDGGCRHLSAAGPRRVTARYERLYDRPNHSSKHSYPANPALCPII